MHPAAFSYVTAVRSEIPEPTRVVEFGSYDVNGSVRELFPAADWFGIDTRPGKGVDLVADVRSWEGGERYDLVVTTEMLEHCANPERVIEQAWWALRPGGYLIGTMAGPGRDPHNGDGDPWTPESGEHYGNISPDDLTQWLQDWVEVKVVSNPVACDVYCVARKPTEGH